MKDTQVADRAFTLAEMSSDDSVKMAILAGRESRFSAAEPLNEAPVTYLGKTEAPAYVLTNAKRGIGLGTKNNTVTPEGDRRTVILVTGRRSLCLVGKQGVDETIEIPHESVAATAYSTGFRKHRLVLRTPESAYHCWVHRKTEESLLERVTEFIGDHQLEDPEELESTDDSASTVMYRGRPVAVDELASDGDGTNEDGTTGGGDDPVTGEGVTEDVDATKADDDGTASVEGPVRNDEATGRAAESETGTEGEDHGEGEGSSDSDDDPTDEFTVTYRGQVVDRD